jgi:hypothetical protein
VNGGSHVDRNVAADVVLFQMENQAKISFHHSIIKGETKLALLLNA